MIRTVVKHNLTLPTIVFGIIIGLLVAPTSTILFDAGTRQFDRWYPVVTGNIEVVEQDARRVVIDMNVTKHRDCMFVRLVGYSVDHDGTSNDARVMRIGEPETGFTRAPGVYALGLWEIAPKSANAARVKVEAIHSCGVRLVRSLVGEAFIK